MMMFDGRLRVQVFFCAAALLKALKRLEPLGRIPDELLHVDPVEGVWPWVCGIVAEVGYDSTYTQGGSCLPSLVVPERAAIELA